MTPDMVRSVSIRNQEGALTLSTLRPGQPRDATHAPRQSTETRRQCVRIADPAGRTANTPASRLRESVRFAVAEKHLAAAGNLTITPFARPFHRTTIVGALAATRS
jgi:hypothetical protein